MTQNGPAYPACCMNVTLL